MMQILRNLGDIMILQQEKSIIRAFYTLPASEQTHAQRAVKSMPAFLATAADGPSSAQQVH